MQMRNLLTLNEIIFQKEPIQEDITNSSSELLQMVKELKSEMESVKKKKWEDSESSGGAKSDFNGKISY